MVKSFNKNLKKKLNKMLNSSTTSSIRILPNNKVYRQLFDAQVFIY